MLNKQVCKRKKKHKIGNILEKIDRFLSHKSPGYLKVTQIKQVSFMSQQLSLLHNRKTLLLFFHLLV